MGRTEITNEIVQINEIEYKEILLQAVAVIETARTNIARHIAATTSNTYWEIGKLLYDRKLESKHGSGVIKRLSIDLKERFPKMGMSPRQLWNMKSFYTRYKDSDTKLLRSVALLPWSHNLLILSKDLNDKDSLYYAQESISKGWNRDFLLNAIKLKMHETHPIMPSDNNFETYLSILDRTERQKGENPSIGIILCAEKDHVDVELALEGMTKPIGVADYQLIIPKEELQKTITAEIQSFEEEQASKSNKEKDEPSVAPSVRPIIVQRYVFFTENTWKTHFSLHFLSKGAGNSPGKFFPRVLHRQELAASTLLLTDKDGMPKFNLRLFS